MKKPLLAPLVIFGIVALAVVLASWLAFPGWRSTPGGFWSLTGVAAVGSLAFLKALVDYIKTFQEINRKEQKTGNAPGKAQAPRPLDQRSQKVSDSPDAEQVMRGKGGKMTQESKNSRGSKQTME